MRTPEPSEPAQQSGTASKGSLSGMGLVIRSLTLGSFSINLLLTAAGCLIFSLVSSGCVSKATAQAQARAAYLAGQQQALERIQQNQNRGPTVTFIGEVKNSLIPWTAELTLSKAIVAADYFGSVDPKEIVVTRDGQEMRIDPKQLLSGHDILLQPRDVVELRH